MKRSVPGFLLLSEGVVTIFSAVVVLACDVAIFSFSVVTPDHTVAAMPQMNGHKKRAAGGALFPKSP